MKKEIISKLKAASNRLGKMIKSIEQEDKAETIIDEIQTATIILLKTKRLILRDFLLQIGSREGFTRKESEGFGDLLGLKIKKQRHG